MDNRHSCKACSASVKISEEEIRIGIEKLSKLRGMRFVDDSIYVKRLEQCSSCQYLEYDTTCLQCGCIVQIKAKLPDSTCPYPKASKW